MLRHYLNHGDSQLCATQALQFHQRHRTGGGVPNANEHQGRADQAPSSVWVHGAAPPAWNVRQASAGRAMRLARAFMPHSPRAVNPGARSEQCAARRRDSDRSPGCATRWPARSARRHRKGQNVDALARRKTECGHLRSRRTFGRVLDDLLTGSDGRGEENGAKESL